MAGFGAKEGPDPVDRHVGRRVRARRLGLGVTQAVLAERIGVTFQQVQKYERGANRISVSKLYRIAEVLSASIGFFFEGLPDPASDGAGKIIDRRWSLRDELLASAGGAELTDAILSMRPDVRRSFVGLAREVACAPDAALAAE